MEKTIVRVKDNLKYNFIDMQRVMTLKEMASVTRTCKADIIIEKLEKNEIAEATLIIEGILNKGGKVAYSGNAKLNINGVYKFESVEQLKEEWFGSKEVNKVTEEILTETIEEEEQAEPEIIDEVVEQSEPEIVEEETVEEVVNTVIENKEESNNEVEHEVEPEIHMSEEEINSIRKEYESKIKELEEKHLIEIEKLKDEVDKAKASSREQIDRTESNFSNISENYDRLTEKYNNLEMSYNGLKEDSENAYKEVCEAKAKVEERLNREVENRNINYEIWTEAVINGEEYRKKFVKLSEDFEQANKEHGEEIERINNQHSEAVDNINNEHKNEVDNLNKKIGELEESINNYKGSMESLQSLGETLSKSKEDLESANMQIAELTKKVEESGVALRDKDSVIAKLTDTVNSLKDSSSESIFKPILYSGEAKIISVFGFGSYGITTVAHTLACECMKKGKTVIVELDLERQSLRDWCRCTDDVSDTSLELVRTVGPKKITLNNSSKTGLNFLILRKAQFFKENLNKLVVKRNSLDYIIGTNLKLTDYELTEIEFEEMLKILSENYEYIILDLGNIGYSQFQMSYTRSFAEISNLNVVIDKDIKSWNSMKSMEAKFDKSKIDKSKTVFINNFISQGIKIDGTPLSKFKGYIAIRYNKEMLSNTNIVNTELNKLVEI